VFLHACAASGTVNLDTEEHQNRAAMLVRESTYMRSSLGSRRRSASRYLPRARVQDSSLRFVRYSS